MVIEQIQDALKRNGLNGWLFFDHHRRDPLAYRILQLPPTLEPSRRWYYFIPSDGEPVKLVHRIESSTLDSLPGKKESYSSWSEQQDKLWGLLRGRGRIAMQYSPRCAIPYVSMIDAGTAELVRSAGVEILSSADLVQEFEARWSDEQLQMHLEAGKLVDQVRREAFDLIRHHNRSGRYVTEYEVQQFILSRFSQLGLTTDHGPNVSVNGNASNPHYEPARELCSPIQQDDLVLIDLWAKLIQPDSVYYDITWTGFCGGSIPSHIQNIFEIVRDARNAAVRFAIEKAAGIEPFAGYEVDDVARHYIEEQGFGEYFFHRTGHSIGTEVHGTGANMDNLESHDERRVIARTCFSIEPGIYLPGFGIRSEVNVYVGDGFGRVTGEVQEKLVHI
ncbi:MAG TPA: M24 family metallopeptidase [Bryobacteraceae bacterium]|nr:M24 family metallopeptidase [Bryobacteraceae bacterium]